MRRFRSLRATYFPNNSPQLIAILATVILGSIWGCESSSISSSSQSRLSRPKIEHVGLLEVQDENGTTQRIQDYADGKHLVVIVSRGYHGSVCPFCCAQTQSLASQYSKIEELGGKVLVVRGV